MATQAINDLVSDGECEHWCERYARQILMPDIGKAGQERLMSSHVLIAGVGGLGSFSSLYLAAAGVGRLTLIDNGLIALSDLNRQILYSTEKIHRPKVEMAEKRLHELNPDIIIEPIFEEMTDSSMPRWVKGVNAVVDATDNFRTRRVLNRACFEAQVPFIYGGVFGLKGSVASVLPGQTPCLECFIPASDGPGKPVPVVAPTVGLVAAIQAMETLRILLGKEGLLAGQLLKIDGATVNFQRFKLSKRKGCPVCGMI